MQSHFLTRRRLLQHGSTVLAVGAVGRRGSTALVLRSNANVAHAAVCDAGQATVDPSTVHALAMQALDAARSAGATYADVRLTRTIRSPIMMAGERFSMSDEEQLGLGVRVLVNGYWGFAATPYWTADEAARVGRTAAAQATVNARGPARSMDWGRIPAATGSWTTPIRLDPFRLSVEERLDMLWAQWGTLRRLVPQVTQYGADIHIFGGAGGGCERQEVALATSEGSYVTQTVYRAQSSLVLEVGGEYAFATGCEEAGRGWEMFDEAALFAQIPQMVAFLDQPPIAYRPVEVGRKPIVCDATTMARLLDATLGRGTEIDRALGYEANATGTSYLGPDPLTFLGTPVAHEMVTVTANRSLPTGLATVQWDADGIVPEDFTVVKAGTLVDYQTTREQAPWLAPWYTKAGTPMRSHGCAAAQDALCFPMQQTPNLALAPAATDASFEDLVAGLSDGIAIQRGFVETDFQCKNGLIRAYGPPQGSYIFQVKNGKRVAKLSNAGILFNATDLWKNVIALGGATSVQHVPCSEVKGEPQQETKHTVSVPPGVFKDLPIIDLRRKA